VATSETVSPEPVGGARQPRHGAWSEHPFADDLIMSEDQKWSRRMLLAGYTIRYEPRAAVRHSHDYSIPGAFRRFFDSGVSAERSFVGEQRSSSAVLRREGRQVRPGGGLLALAYRQAAWIPYTAVYELAKIRGASARAQAPLPASRRESPRE
jgi:hypothetical protein